MLPKKLFFVLIQQQHLLANPWYGLQLSASTVDAGTVDFWNEDQKLFLTENSWLYIYYVFGEPHFLFSPVNKYDCRSLLRLF